MKLKDYQLDTAARLVASGYPVGAITQTVGCSERDLKALIDGKDTEFTGYLAEYRREFNKLSREHVERLEHFLPAAYDAYDMALQGTDVRLASEKAKEVFEANFGPMGHHKAPAKREAAPTTQVFISAKEQSVLSLTINAMKAQMAVFGPATSFQDHLKTGDEALPTPESQRQIMEGEALPVVEHDTDTELSLVELDD